MSTASPNATIPLTAAQACYLRWHPEHPEHFTLSRLWQVPQDLNLTLVQRAMRYVQMHHEALRLRFVSNQQISVTRAQPHLIDALDYWQQYVGTAYDEIPFQRIDLRSVPAEQQAAAIASEADVFQGSLDLQQGPLWRVVHFDLGSEVPGRLLVIVHHLVADGFSLPIVMEDLWTVYHQLRAGRPMRLLPVPTPFSICAQEQYAYAQTSSVQRDLAYWQGQAWEHTGLLPRDQPADWADNTVGSRRGCYRELNHAETNALLQAATTMYQAQPLEILLTALALTLLPWMRVRALQVSVLMSGRQSQTIFGEHPLSQRDLGRTVGYCCFGTEHLLLELDPSSPVLQAIALIKEQFRALPHQGFSSPWLAELSQDTSLRQQMGALPHHEVLFNYQGQRFSGAAQHLWPVALESPGQTSHTANPRRALLICRAVLAEQRLQVVWEYSQRLHREETVQALADTYMHSLRRIVASHISL